MEAIKSPLTRKLLEDELKKLRNEFTDYFDPHTLSTFENELKLIDQQRRAAIKTNSKHAEPIILTSYVGLISLVDLGRDAHLQSPS